ncbi:hypothetical protein PPE_05650 [Paenibacillus polymyxa E681]|nr:hypothetical protein PPE_05650 [Paenibacillus polymyxa E681]
METAIGTKIIAVYLHNSHNIHGTGGRIDES